MCERWRATQAKFVDQPASALTDADALLDDVMRERGYPVEDFEQQASDVSVDHPEVVDHYREAHAIHSGKGESTEDLRQAMVHYARCSRNCSKHRHETTKQTDLRRPRRSSDG